MGRRKLWPLKNLGPYAQHASARTRKRQEKNALEQENQGSELAKDQGIPRKRVSLKPVPAAAALLSRRTRSSLSHTAANDVMPAAGANLALVSGLSPQGTSSAVPALALVDSVAQTHSHANTLPHETSNALLIVPSRYVAGPSITGVIPAALRFLEPVVAPDSDSNPVDSAEQHNSVVDVPPWQPPHPMRSIPWHPPTADEALVALKDLRDGVQPWDQSGHNPGKIERDYRDAMVVFLTHFTNPRSPGYQKWSLASRTTAGGLNRGTSWEASLRKRTREFVLARWKEHRPPLSPIQRASQLVLAGSGSSFAL